MKQTFRKTTMMLAAGVLLGASAMAQTTWSCGSPNEADVTATLSGSTLTISGTGAMANYAYSSMPWYNDRTSITNVVISSGVTSIGANAFYNCSSLAEVSIPAGVTSIGAYAFANCSSLAEVIIPMGVTSIEDQTFSSCRGLTSVTIPEGVTTIGMAAFQSCTSLTELNLPASVDSINQYAVFRGSSSLAAINVAEGNTAYSSVEGVLFNAGKTTLVCFPAGKSVEYTIPAEVDSICSDAFMGCTSLTAITCLSATPPSLDNILSYRTFVGVTATLYVPCALPYAMTVGWNALNIVSTSDDCDPCVEFAIGELTATLCPDDSTLTISGTGAMPESGTNPWVSSYVKTVEIEAGVTGIRTGTFNAHNNLVAINVNAANDSYITEDGVLYNKNKSTIIQYPAKKQGSGFTIPSGVTSIEDYAFYGCVGLTSVVISNGVTSIGDGAFYGCVGLTSVA